MMRTKYLIVGNSAGGIGAAEAIREVDKAGALTILSDEPYPAYSRPLISKYLAGECTLHGMLFRPAEFYRQNNIDSLLGRKVKRLELASHTAELDDGEGVLWEKLLLAPGGTPIVPRIEGVSKRGVFTFTTLDDAKAIDEFLGHASKAVVIGGGLIGISATEALVKRGIQVTVVEMREAILNTILDERGSQLAGEALQGAGVNVVTGHTVAEISGELPIEAAVLENGVRIPCDLVVVAVGVSPRTELALSSGIKVNRGVVIDRHMATSYPDVYSCGDAAEAYDSVYGANRLTPIWPNAYLGGRVAGYNMAGIQAEYPDTTAMNSLNYFGLDIAAAGMVSPPDETGFEVLSKQRDGVYQKVVLRNNAVTGLVFVKNIEKAGILFGLMRERVDVSSFKQELLADDFGLVSLPRELRQERIGPLSGSVSRIATPTETVEDLAGE